MSTAARIGHGTKVQYGDGASPEVFTSFGEINSFKPFSVKADTVDATDMDSPDAWREFIPGLKDAGEFSFEMNMIPNSPHLTALFNHLNSQTVRNYRFLFPLAGGGFATWQVAAFCTGVDADVPMDDKMKVSVTFKISGQPGFIS